MRYIVRGIAIGILFGLVGCGGVDDRGLGDASGAGGTVVTHPDAGVDSGAGTGGAGGTTVTGTGGAAGDPGRPLGAGCTTDDQCGSGICDSATSVCCSGRADSCNTCIGGYLTPKKDGTSCGIACNGSAFTQSTCQTGVCTASAPMDCTQRFCTGYDHQACAANPHNLCETPDAGGSTGCVCFLVATVTDPSCP